MKGKRGRGTAASDEPPVLGMIERGGQLVLQLCANVQQHTIRPHILTATQPGSVVNTDEYAIYARLPSWGLMRVTVNHGRGEFARDDDGVDVNEVHVNTREDVWSLLRSWLRPHRGISQWWLPLYLAFFQAMHNIRCRGFSLLEPMLTLLLIAAPRNAG
ncbi:transposase [Deinococcus marmoris]|uniref:transposase n=1 Tax=Deinococcus marmoris TaxID=249408 RepID=UPI001C37A475|nr:transposase [Deinococcus marmoris]